LMTAYADAAGRPGPTIVSDNLAGQVLTPGLYTSAATSFQITSGNLTLDAQGDANAVWIFQMPASTLTLTAPTCNVILINGAQFSNIFWQVGSSATIGGGCVMEGNILANTSITLVSGATVHGRALGGAVAATGAVTLDTNSVSAAGSCNQ
jgi:Ice-binding-like